MNVEQRINKLERQNRIYQCLFLTIGVLSLVAVNAGFTKQDTQKQVNTTISATEFVLLDGDGNPRGTWALNGTEPQLVMHGSGDKAKASKAILGVVPIAGSPAFLKLIAPSQSSEVNLLSDENGSRLQVSGHGKTPTYAQMSAGADKSPLWNLTYGGEVRVSGVAHLNSSQVKVSIGGMGKTLEVK